MPRYNLNREEVDLLTKALSIASKDSSSISQFNRFQNLSTKLKSKIELLDKMDEIVTRKKPKDDPDAIH